MQAIQTLRKGDANRKGTSTETIVGGIRPSRSVAIKPYTVNQTLTLCSVSDISLRDSRKRTCTRYGESRVSPGGNPCMTAIDP